MSDKANKCEGKPGPAARASDEELARRSARGCRLAFGELVARHERGLYNFVLRRSGSVREAEDLTQDAFVEAWKSIARYSDKWRFSTWLYTIASRQAIHYHRRRKRSIEFEGEAVDYAAHDDAADSLFEKHEARENLWSIIDRVLSPEQRDALWLRYVEDHNVSDIGRILGRSPVTVRVILFRARQALLPHVQALAREGDVELPQTKATLRTLTVGSP